MFFCTERCFPISAVPSKLRIKLRVSTLETRPERRALKLKGWQLDRPNSLKMTGKLFDRCHQSRIALSGARIESECITSCSNG